ncbi:hypothetical protein VT91_08200 [Clostridium sporogenes]|uniref:hypothetical protein n=1 Tax=Clostridium botulinum TaxID=1491 RepID=UPI000717A630|nr:hypothetical protein [Clostridium botulinum]KRU25017.1 hypothetical protein VT28_35050 [Clostridium sporogenes]KRU31910.1 hypothetical protein WG71_04160 [Clostridium sporogenes]KRU34178.1 hypothetical protein VT91_08200 [Clostridium sporogenes]KRU41195.1 hypothetical protein VT95_24220 [Clostridium sporogenes]MBZ1328217.1 hypothetical protein [Clostridium botulinum]
MYGIFQCTQEFISFSPVLAKVIGLNEAIILQKLNDLIELNKNDSRYLKEGSIWTNQSVAALCEKYFPYMSLSTVKRAIYKLKKLNLIKIKRFYSEEVKSGTNWYSLNYKAIENMIVIEDKSTEVEELFVLGKGQNEPIIDELLIRELEEIEL